jgi:hypothetical protein
MRARRDRQRAEDRNTRGQFGVGVACVGRNDRFAFLGDICSGVADLSAQRTLSNICTRTGLAANCTVY